MVTQMLNAFGVGGNQVNPVLQSLLDWIQGQEEARRDDYDRYRAYYSGDQEVKLTDRLKRYLENQGLSFRDNFCSLVVDTLAERLSVIGFSGPSDEVNAQAWNFWQRNRMDYQQNVIQTEAIMLGDAYVMVDWDLETSRPRFTPQRAEMIIPHYNEATQQLDWLSKKWVEKELGEEPITRLNLYYPNRIEKYVARGGVWRQFIDPLDESMDWPLPWVDQRGRPIGVTVKHFRNKPLSAWFGESEIGDVVPLQDLLNKTLVDLVMVLDTMAMGQRYTVGINHGSSRLNVIPGSIAEFHVEPDTPFEVGEFAAQNPEGMLKTLEALVQHIAGVSRTPQYLFQLMGGAPSGEALKTAESGLVNKAKRRQVNFGNAWEDVMAMAFRVQSAFGSGGIEVDALDLQTEWADPESRNEESHLNSLKIKAELGVPLRQLWRELGYDEDEIAQMEEDKQAERVRDTNIGAELLRSFSGGGNI